jgi:hypothetical protein
MQGYKKAHARAWRGRYVFLSGYSDLLGKAHSLRITTNADLEELLRIASDKSVQTVDRVFAYFTRGLASWDNSDRSEAARMYNKALRLSGEASAADRGAMALFNVARQLYTQRAGNIIDYHAHHSRTNLSAITGTGTVVPTTDEERAAGKWMSWPDPAGSAAEQQQQQQWMDNAMRVRRDECARCGKLRSADGVKLLVCVRCNLLWYCGKECQKAHWKAVHKHQCRDPKGFHAGDIVRLSDLDEADKALQDHFFRVVGAEPGVENGWRLAHGRLLPADGAVMLASQMQRVLAEWWDL